MILKLIVSCEMILLLIYKLKEGIFGFSVGKPGILDRIVERMADSGLMTRRLVCNRPSWDCRINASEIHVFYMRQRLHVDIMFSHRVLVSYRVSHTNTVQ